MSETVSAPSCHRRWLWVILAVSLALRVGLAAGGGQYYWGDEQRYGSAKEAFYDLAHGEWSRLGAELFGHADHPLFRFFGLVPAAWEYFAGPSPRMAASYFGLFSVLAIFLVWQVARRAGAGEREALLAAFLAAASNSLFFYSRHFFPYDISLCWMLWALWLGLGPWAVWRSLFTGVLAGLGFLTYNGYWLLGACVLLLHTLAGDGGKSRRVWRSALAVAGLMLPVGLLCMVGAALGHNLIAAFREFSGTVTQGDFGLGYRVITESLWYAERGLLVVWLAALVAGVVWVVRRRQVDRLTWWSGALLLLLGGTWFFSDVVPKFVVYGRFVRCAVPFLCLGAAYGIEIWWPGWPRLVRLAGIMLVMASAAMNFSAPLRLVFPEQFYRLAQTKVEQSKAREPGIYRAVRTENLWGVDVSRPLPPHDTLLREPHPLRFRPYQYEGYSAAQRADFARHDISMRLIRLRSERMSALQRGHPDWADYPGPVRMRLKLSMNKPGMTEPLITAGREPAGDYFFIRYEDGSHIRLGLDHCGEGAIVSAPRAVDFQQPHTLVISMGSLLPPTEGKFFQAKPELRPLREHLLVVLDGEVVFSRPARFYPVRAEEINFASNWSGGTTCTKEFTGEVLELRREPLDGVLRAVAPLAAQVPWRDATWGGAIGPVELTLALDKLFLGLAEPLAAIQASGARAVLFIVREKADAVRIGYERMGGDVKRSELLPVDMSMPARIMLSLGSLMPAAGAPIYTQSPEWFRLGELIVVSLNGQTVLTDQQEFNTPAERYAFGANTVGSSAVRPQFGGNILRLEPVDPQRVLAASVQLAAMVGSPAADWQGYPGPVRLRLKFPRGRRQAEPLLVGGKTGAGDILFVRGEDERTVRFGFDHWGAGGPVSDPVVVEFGAEHELVVSVGFLLPPETNRLYQHAPELRGLRRMLYVELDGRVVLRGEGVVHSSDPGQLTLGSNFIGGSTAAGMFTGQIISAERVAPEYILQRVAPAER